MKEFSVDIIIPTFNRAGLIPHSLDSILAQITPPRSVIVIDDGSTDNTERVISNYQIMFNRRNINLQYFYQDHIGVSAARNMGIKFVNSNYVLFLDSDDLISPQYLSEFKISYSADIGDIVYTSYNMIDSCGKLIDNHRIFDNLVYRSGNIYSFLQASNLFIRNLAQAVFPRKIFSPSLRFDENLRCGEDWDILLRISQRHSFRFEDEKLLSIREHGNNTLSDSLLSFTNILPFYKIWLDRGLNHEAGQAWRLDVLSRMIMRLPNTDFIKIARKELSDEKYRKILIGRGGYTINMALVFAKILHLKYRRSRSIFHFLKLFQ